MHPHTNILIGPAKKIMLLLTFCCCSYAVVMAQIDIISALQFNGYTASQAEAGKLPLPNDSRLYETPYMGKTYDLKIPDNPKYSYLYLSAKGADGGAKIAASSASGKTWGGGQGATVSATFKIGTGPGEIPPGSTIRFLVGGKGGSIKSGGNAGGGGGGATGITWKNENTGKWEVLAVAAGGSGAYGDCCTSGWTGSPGKKYVKGEEGDSRMRYDSGYGGSSIGGKEYDATWENYPDGEPTGTGAINASFSTDGGWGFGQGGIGNNAFNEPGGGGGYTGGRGYGSLKNAEGGTSYINETEMLATAIHSQENGGATDPQNGYVRFQFIGDPFYLALKADPIKVMARNVEPGNFDYNADMSLTDRDVLNPGTAKQLWYYDEGTSMIHLAANPGKCMHLPNSDVTNGKSVRAHDCNPSWGSQKWMIDGDLIRLKGNPNKCLVKKYDNHTNGNPAVIWDCGGTSHDRREWTRIYYSPPAFIVLNADTEKALQKDDSSNYLEVGNRGSGSSNNTTYKLWYYDESTSMIRLAAQPDKCINLPYSDTENGKKIAVQDCNPNWGSQRWTLSGKEIHLQNDPTKCLVKRWDANSVDNPIVIWDCGSVSHTRKDWKMQPEYVH